MKGHEKLGIFFNSIVTFSFNYCLVDSPTTSTSKPTTATTTSGDGLGQLDICSIIKLQIVCSFILSKLSFSLK